MYRVRWHFIWYIIGILSLLGNLLDWRWVETYGLTRWFPFFAYSMGNLARIRLRLMPDIFDKIFETSWAARWFNPLMIFITIVTALGVASNQKPEPVDGSIEGRPQLEQQDDLAPPKKTAGLTSHEEALERHEMAEMIKVVSKEQDRRERAPTMGEDRPKVTAQAFDREAMDSEVLNSLIADPQIRLLSDVQSVDCDEQSCKITLANIKQDPSEFAAAIGHWMAKTNFKYGQNMSFTKFTDEREEIAFFLSDRPRTR